MKVIFNNGKSIKITQEVADIINKRLMEGCSEWQTFSDNNQVFLMINLSQISFICKA